MDEQGSTRDARDLSDIRTVVLLHGIWSHGVGMFVVRRQLEREYGLDVHYYNYPSLKGTLDHNAAGLHRFIDRLGKDGVHIVGHSLGGVVALRMLATYEDAPPGRLVCLGSPLAGSRAGAFLDRQNWADGLLGATLPEGVLQSPANEWASHVCETRDVGVIAGNVTVGIGRFVTDLEGENDGTVAVAETRLDGTRDHLVMPFSHRGMVLSSRVADQAWAFLKRGEFLRRE